MKKRKREWLRVRGDSGQRRRIFLVAILLGMAGFLPVCLQLYNLMVVNYDYYADKALNNQTRSTAISADRGLIYDRNMNVLACNQNVETLYLDPHELKQSNANLEEISKNLAVLVDKDPEWIYNQGVDLTKRYKQIAAGIDTEIAGKIRSYINENKISGIHLEPGERRYYPYETLASQLIGFTNASNSGAEGIEAAYNTYLEGSTNRVVTTKGNNEMDMPFSYENYVSSQPGNHLVLTLDVTVQACLEKRLEEAIARYDVQNGAFGMVMNVNTGEILAMATAGGYDPNHYSQIADPEKAAELEEMQARYMALPEGSQAYQEAKNAYNTALQEARLKQWRNRCLSDGYEPGSTFKVITMAAALDCGAIDLETNFYCAGAEQIPGRSQLLHCWRSTGHGSEKTAQALQNSCNIAFAHIALKLGGERFYAYVENFGILEKTGIDLNGESKGVFFEKALVTNTDKWGTASLTSGSFGQTFKLTPLQLVRGIAAVVNGGYLLEPYVVSEVIDAQGNVILRQEPTVLRQVIKPETSAQMRRLLLSVVEEGTAKNASVAGFSIGGKTGTSEKIDVFDENGQRVQDKIVSFVGIAPMDNPEYIVLVALDTPSRTTGIYISGGVMAAPTVGAVMEDILPYLGVERVYKADEAAGKTVVVEDLIGMNLKQAEAQLKKLGLTAKYIGNAETVTSQLPLPGETIPGNGQLILYFGGEAELRNITIPNFSGMDRLSAINLAEELGLYILLSGNTELRSDVQVIGQSLPAGAEVQVGTTIELKFADIKAADQ